MRLVRRKHQKRLKRKRSRYWGGVKADDAKTTGKKYAAPKPRSKCPCCINARAIEGPTRQERSVRLSEQLDDLAEEDTFVCSRCLTVTWESDRAEGTMECVYCC